GDLDYTILCDSNSNTLLFNTLNNTYPITTITAACSSSLCCTFRGGKSSTSYMIRVRGNKGGVKTSFHVQYTKLVLILSCTLSRKLFSFVYQFANFVNSNTL
ncbi:hypothetical protein CFOL_v3_14698, partial [Cephalotus follicularis]